MPNNYLRLYVHLIWKTWDHLPLVTPDVRAHIFPILLHKARELGCSALAIGGVEDHVHMLVRFGRTISIADWLRETKRSSSSHARGVHPNFSWQAGYGVFAVETDRVPQVSAYIRNQEEHHKAFSYQDELRKLMTEQGVAWDERYFWE